MNYTKSQRQERDLTRKVFAEDASIDTFGPELTEIIDLLHLYERRLHTIAEYSCNGDLTHRQETSEKNTEKKVQAIADKLGFEVYFNGDPRGGAIRFILPSKRSNGWDGETWGIYY